MRPRGRAGLGVSAPGCLPRPSQHRTPLIPLRTRWLAPSWSVGSECVVTAGWQGRQRRGTAAPVRAATRVVRPWIPDGSCGRELVEYAGPSSRGGASAGGGEVPVPGQVGAGGQQHQRGQARSAAGDHADPPGERGARCRGGERHEQQHGRPNRRRRRRRAEAGGDGVSDAVGDGPADGVAAVCGPAGRAGSRSDRDRPASMASPSSTRTTPMASPSQGAAWTRPRAPALMRSPAAIRVPANPMVRAIPDRRARVSRTGVGEVTRGSCRPRSARRAATATTSRTQSLGSTSSTEDRPPG
jgi:hypothetical protein